MNVADWMMQELRGLFVEYVFLVPGGEIDPLVASLGAQDIPTPIVACHEEGAGFMADGHARVKGEFSVCFAIGAPGAANTVPAILAATSDRSKVLFISGGYPTTEFGRGGFQDSSIDGTDDALLIKPVARYSESCHIAQNVPRKFYDALKSIHQSVSGPAHLTLPKDIQLMAIKPPALPQKILQDRHRLIDIAALNKFLEFIEPHEKIALLLGRGAVLSDAGETLLQFIEHHQLPFALTFAAKGLLPETHPLCLGMFGYAGHRRAIETILAQDLEVLLCLGTSLNARDTLAWSDTLGQHAKLVQLDIDYNMLERNYLVDMSIQGDVDASISYLNHCKNNALEKHRDDRKNWMESIKKIPLFYDEENIKSEATPLEPAAVIRQLNDLLPDDTICFIDSGAHRAFAGHYWLTKKGGRVVSATNIGPMGWAIPAAIGGKLAAKDKTVVVITGDGCMRMHGIEIATAARYQIPVIFFISNNCALGNVYLREKKVNQGAIEMTELPLVDWVAFATALGGDGITVDALNKLPEAVEKAKQSKGPFVLNVITNRDRETPVGPYQKTIQEHLGREF